MATFRELLNAARQRITEIDPETAESRLNDATFLDVRELDEFEQGMIPGAVFLPRGHLESQVENKLGDKDAPIVVYCAGGTRSAFAADARALLITITPATHNAENSTYAEPVLNHVRFWNASC